MTTQILLIVCVILLLSYIFDLTSKKTKIPTVILLLLMGWGLKQGTLAFQIETPDLKDILPVLGTVGLILIVLEGSLDLEIDKHTLPVIRKSFFLALFPFLIMAFGLAYAFHYFGGYDFEKSLLNAIPFCIISSAIAIPSVQNLSQLNKTFITYESSLSDIVGVVIFNFVALNTNYNIESFGFFFLEILIVIVISLVATILLSLLLSRLNHHIKFGPILILVVLIYAITKIYHLPGLIFIMIFGLTLSNIDQFNSRKWFKHFKPEKMNAEIEQFKDIVAEATFLIRSLFFILFGFLIETTEVFDTATLSWSGAIVGGILVLRVIFLSIIGLKIFPLLFIAPRGLITILLFFSILPEDVIPIVNNSMIIQVILLSIIIMMLGMLFSKKEIDVSKS